MNLVLNNGMFQELSSEEMFAIDGGDFWQNLGDAGVVVIGTVVGLAAVVSAPISVPVAAVAVGVVILWGIVR